MKPYRSNKVIKAAQILIVEAGLLNCNDGSTHPVPVKNTIAYKGYIPKTGDYLLESDDGSREVHPKSDFEGEYSSLVEFELCVPVGSYEWAMLRMKADITVRPPFWPEDESGAVQFPDEESKMSFPYFYKITSSGRVPWTPSAEEVFCEEWEEA